MNNDALYPGVAIYPTGSNQTPNGIRLLRLVRAAQPVTRTELAERLSIDKSTVTDRVKLQVRSGLLVEEATYVEAYKRRGRVVSFADSALYVAGVNLGVRRTQVGISTLGGGITGEYDFRTPSSPTVALRAVRDRIKSIVDKRGGVAPAVIGVSVPGMTDSERQSLVYAPNLGWRNIDIAAGLRIKPNVNVVVENDSTAAAMYEAGIRLRTDIGKEPSTFVLVRSGTGIGVGIVLAGEVFRGSGDGRGLAGEFGHMTIAAGGAPCECGNQGCWEKYASAGAAGRNYAGKNKSSSTPRFVEIVELAKGGDKRAKSTLKYIGEHLGIGIANVIMGIGVSRVIISGRLVHGWQFIEEPLNSAIERSFIGKISGWSVEAGEPVGSAIGGALEVAIEELFSSL